ncbi:hypothetical protein [Nonomuraea sp. SYSU D8015]|uniref:hypothetical protein n=1 Tax=Nonomuraea sp. SYSU D8015 TaxID=2593644 RepID=UPI0016616894|nr:hypothetical protein [Nonomuraea sp. SYSU D8015]
MGDKTTTKFPTMGTEAANVRNVSGAPSSYTKPVRKSGNAKGGMIEAALSEGVRRQTHERHGATYAPRAQMVVGNDPAESANLRNTRIVRSAVGNRDFWAKRQYGQGM